MTEFKPHDYFNADDQGYISRKVFIEHVRKTYDQIRELADYIKQYEGTIDTEFIKIVTHVNEHVKQLTDLYNDLLDNNILDSEIQEKLTQLEQNYAPRLSTLEQNDVSLTAHLQQTVKKDEPSSITWEMADQNFREISLGDKPMPVVGVDSVGTVNIINKSVSRDKLDEQLNDAIYAPISLSFEIGTIDGGNGNNSVSSTRIRSTAAKAHKGAHVSFYDSAFRYMIFKYHDDGFTSTGWLNAPIYYFDSETSFRIVFAYNDNREFDTDSLESAGGNISLSTPLAYTISNGSYTPPQEPVIYTTSVKQFIKKTVFEESQPNGVAIVGNEYWSFGASADDHSDTNLCKRFLINEDYSLTQIGQFTHNWGHVNTIDYMPQTDSIVFGNGSSDYSLPGKFTIMQNVSSFKDLSHVDYDEHGIVFDLSGLNWGQKVNVIWGEANDDQYNNVYVITNDNKDIRRLLLGKGSNILSSGNLIEGKQPDEFNGTYTHSLSFSQPDGGDVLQDAFFGSDGHIYGGLGHSQLWIVKMTLVRNGYSGKIHKEYIQNTFYAPSGEAIGIFTQSVKEYKNVFMVKLRRGSESIVYVFKK